MSDKDTLHDAFAPLGHAPTGPNYTHPQADEILRDAVALLQEIPEGKRLAEQIRLLNLTIRVILGREIGYFTPDAHIIMLSVPKNMVINNPYEIAVNLGMGIKEIEGNMLNVQLLKSNPNLGYKKYIDVVIEMCQLVSEFYDVKNHTKLVDLINQIGHAEVYKLFRSKADYKEMADQIIKTVT